MNQFDLHIDLGLPSQAGICTVIPTTCGPESKAPTFPTILPRKAFRAGGEDAEWFVDEPAQSPLHDCRRFIRRAGQSIPHGQRQSLGMRCAGRGTRAHDATGRNRYGGVSLFERRYHDGELARQRRRELEILRAAEHPIPDISGQRWTRSTRYATEQTGRRWSTGDLPM